MSDHENRFMDNLTQLLSRSDEQGALDIVENVKEYKYFMSDVNDLKLKLLDKYNRLRFLQHKCRRSMMTDDNVKKEIENLHCDHGEPYFQKRRSDFTKEYEDKHDSILKNYEIHMDKIYKEALSLFKRSNSQV